MKFLNEHIKTQTFKQIYLLYGEEHYLVNQYKERLKQAIIGDDTMNYSHYEGSRTEIKELIDTADTMPFFAERRLILVENSGFFKTSADELTEYIKKMPDYLYIIFVENDLDKRSRLYKAVSTKGYVSEMKFQSESVLIRWIEDIVKKEGRTISRQTAQYLLSQTGICMDIIRTELEKLICYTIGRSEISNEDIDAVCTVQIQNKIFDMITAIAAGKQKQALDMYYDLLLLREPPMRILYLITRQFNMLLQVRELVEQRYDAQAIASQMKIAPFLVSRYISQSKSFTASQLRRALESFAEYETDVKTGKLDDKMAVELIIIRYSSR